MMAAIVDLDKVREVANERKAVRSKSAKQALKTKRKKAEVVSIFALQYKMLMGSEYELQKARVRSRQTDNGTERYRVDSDANRLFRLYNQICSKYKGNLDDYQDYIRFAIRTALGVDYIRTTPQFFGFVVSDKVLADFFFERRKHAASQRAKNDNVTEMSSKHARLFNQ
jgi:hypothetical protein